MKMFSLFDKKAGVFYTPFFNDNEATALRAVKAAVNADAHSVLTDNPEDFELYVHGDFDQKVGLTACEKTPICCLVDLKIPDELKKPHKVNSVFEEDNNEET